MIRKQLQKKLCLAIAGVSLFALMGTGCSKSKDTDNAAGNKSDKKVTLKMALWSEGDYKYLTETNKLAEAYKKVNPNVDIEIEHIAPKEYDNTMKIRNSASQLPDVFPIRQSNLTSYADVMVPLNDLKATENNQFAKDLSIKGNVLGIPQAVFNEFVFYKKSIFKEYNLQVPKTWDEFIKACETIKAGKKYIPLLIGAKDSWTDYPFNEYMPMLEAGDGDYYNKMAAKDEPFKKGEPFYTAYEKIQKLYDAKVCGDDPLGYGWDQARAMFVANKGAMMAAGGWYKDDYNQNGGKDDDLGVFLLPTRNSESDPFYTTAMTEMFWGIPKTSKNQKEAKEFVEWLFASDYYKDWQASQNVAPTVKGLKFENKFFGQAFDGIDVKYVTVFYNEDYNKIANAINFDVKGIGQQMISGKNLDDIMKDLNTKWTKARAK